MYSNTKLFTCNEGSVCCVGATNLCFVFVSQRTLHRRPATMRRTVRGFHNSTGTADE
jgi:hypothetical protein